jgi:hypothetical protein
MSQHITANDIESKLRQIQSEVGDAAGEAKPAIATVAATAIGLVVGVAYFVGFRKARKQTTVVEIRRI